MRKVFIGILAALAITLLLAPACNTGKSTVQLGQEFQMKPGQQASIEGQDLVIQFLRVTQDSRAPIGVESFWAGQAVCLVHLLQAGHIYEVNFTEIGGSTQAEADYQGYHFVFNVLPYPVAGKDIRFENYRMDLKVTHSA